MYMDVSICARRTYALYRRATVSHRQVLRRCESLDANIISTCLERRADARPFDRDRQENRVILIFTRSWFPRLVHQRPSYMS